MISDLQAIFSDSANIMKRSAIRECLKLTQQPGVISFAGGLPAPGTFPVEDLKGIVAEVLATDGASVLQYSTTEGDPVLRKLLVERHQKIGLDITEENLMVTTASQQSLDFLGKIFVNPGDKVICGLPSYLGGLSAFKIYGAELVGIDFDDHGMRSDKLEEVLAGLKAKGEKPKFIYTIPDFQNPAGISMPRERRLEIITVAQKYDVLIVEDSPYRELRFSGEPIETIYQLDGTGQVILLGSCSKTFLPGFRIGWIIAPEPILDKFITAKQSADLCTSAFVQRIAARYIEQGLYDKNLKLIIDEYREKKDTMLAGFDEHMPAGVSWTRPEGGLFLFLTLPAHLDAEPLFYKAVEEKVAFIIGSVFFCDGGGKNTMRLNFSYVSLEENREGVKRLAQVIKEAL